jgi:TonB-linked SusC/RagA family outer membrane protein
LVGVGLVNAQSRSVSGSVFSADDGQPVIGATVKVKGTTVGTITDTDGKFKINVPESEKTLVISFVGMKTVEIEAKNNQVVRLEADTRQMEEVVVVATALGIKRQEREVGYAATTIKDNFLNQANSTNVDQALNGKISGLNVTTTNSGVFENAKLNIRGIRSLTGNNQPMFVLDGAPVSLSYLSSIAPSDIQDITVLKSAASAALYGPDAVNGVILVTTKKGTTDKTAVSITSSYQASQVAYFPKTQSSFGGWGGESTDVFGNTIYSPIENQLYGPKFDGTIKPIGIVDSQGHQQTGPYSNIHKNDKVDFWNTGSTFQNAISLSSKDYFFSATNADIKGLMPNDKNNRSTLRFSSGKDYGNFSMKYSVNYTYNTYDVVNEADMPNLSTSSYTGSIFANLLQSGANIPILSYKNLNSEWGKYDNYFCEYAWNPYWLIANLRQKGTTNNIMGNIDLSYKISKWLKADVKASSNVTTSSFQNTDGPIVVSDYTVNVLHRSSTQYHNQPGLEFSDMNTTSRINVDAFLSGEVNLDQFNFKYLAGTTTRSNNYVDVAIGGNNLSVPGIYNVSVRTGDANVQTYPYNATINSTLVSGYGNITIGYNNLAFLDLTGRNDWDSRLSEANRSVFYPGASASLIMSDIFPVLKDNSINYLKVRAALNRSGNVNINPYQTQATYSLGAGFPYGNNSGFTTGNTIPNPDLKPEIVTTTEAGFELRLAENDRVGIEATYFNQDNTNQILAVTQSWATGYPVQLANAASFRNWGYELDLKLTPLVKIGNGDFNVLLNATYNNNVVTATQGNVPVVLAGSSNFIQYSASSPTVNEIAMVGQPAFAFQMTDYQRDPATGKVIVDASGNPNLSSSLVVKGRSMPLWVIGISPSYTIGNFSASLTIDYKGGNNYYAGMGTDLDFSGASARSTEYDRQRFVFPNSVYQQGTNTDGTPKYVANTNRLVSDGNYGFWTSATQNTGIATNYFVSAAAWRLREVNISYSLPSKFLRNNIDFLKKATLSLVGKNLLMFLPSSNQWGDPEFSNTANNANANTSGVGSVYQTPSSRYFGATLNVQF